MIDTYLDQISFDLGMSLELFFFLVTTHRELCMMASYLLIIVRTVIIKLIACIAIMYKQLTRFLIELFTLNIFCQY